MVVSRPEKKSLIFANYVFLYLFIYNYLFFLYVFIQVYLYISMYIYMCVYICVCVTFVFISMIMYIYISVCGGEGCLKMRCPFFLSKNPFRNQKKTPRFETYPCIYNILLFWHVFFVSILCRFVQSKIYVFWFSFVFSFFQHHFTGKMYQTKKCVIGDYIFFFVYKENEVSPKKVPIQVIHINNL